MTAPPTLVFLHGIGTGDHNQSWRAPLDQTLMDLGYPGLGGVRVVAPTYADLLREAPEERVPKPGNTIPKLDRATEARLRWEFERKQAVMEERLGRSRSGVRFGPAETAVDLNVDWTPLFAQARRYLRKPELRHAILNRLVVELSDATDVVIVAHSLGSLVGIDLLDALPAHVHVRGFLTIGSPLGYPTLLRHRDVLLDRFPYSKVDSWVNIWNERDPVSLGRGISHHFPEALDIKIAAGFLSHGSSTFTRNQVVAKVIGLGLFGSQTQEVAPVETAIEEGLDSLEMLLMLRIAHGHFLVDSQEGLLRERVEAARSIVQRQLVENLIEAYAQKQRAVPHLLLGLRSGEQPHGFARLSPEESLIPLLLIAASNALAPFEIAMSTSSMKKALGDLSISVGLKSTNGERVFESLDKAQKVVRGSSDNSARWLLGAAGVALLVAGPIGWALAAPAGLAGGAAIVGGLAAFGPGGMIGGLLTAGALTTFGTGATIAALVGAQSSVAVVESTVAQLLAVAIARRSLKLPQDDGVWFTLEDLHVEITRELQHLRPYSDESSPSIKALENKLAAVDRATRYLLSEGLIQLVDLNCESDETALRELETSLACIAIDSGTPHAD